jgi:putative ABC transport system ATP-binding protein
MHAMEVRDVTKTYAQGEAAMTALAGVTLDVRRGELALLMGPSGSGKTTLLSVMGCILRPTSGSVRILGEEVTTLSEQALPAIRRDRVGFIFQGFNLFPTLTALQNVELALDITSRTERRNARRARAIDLLTRVGLEHKLHAYPADLSGGQKQRVAIARALSGNPPIVLGDEPTAALDSNAGRRVMELLRSLAHDLDRAVVIVTHDSRMVGFADRIIRIEDGVIVGDEAVASELFPTAVENGSAAVAIAVH